jgi:hypothetical protein
MKTILLALITITLLGYSVEAQTMAELRDELEREKLLTEIANERNKREYLISQQENRYFESRQREIYNRRSQNDQITNANSQQIRNINELTNVITNGLRNIQILGSQR